MGYRSEVVLVVGKEVMPQFMVTMAKSSEARALCFDEAERMKDYDGEGNMLFSWCDIKWYEDYEGIQAIVDFMDWCMNESVPHPDEKDTRVDGDECFRFIRIGEESNDIEEIGSGFWDVGVRRTIEY
jgi:hypothetical protein